MRTLIQALKTKELRKKILFVLFIIIVYRIGSFIPTPGVDYNVVNKCMATIGSASQENFIGLVNLFSGGAMLQLSIFALGVMPYITASIVVQLLRVVIPRFEALHKEGQSGEAKLTQYTRYLTIGLAVLQSTTILVTARSGALFNYQCDQVIPDGSVFNLVVMVLIMTGGTGLYLHGGAWEQISWSKEDATGPFSLTAADGTPLTVAPGKSFIAIWGGYYGQALRLTAADGSEQTLPEKPALLASGVTDEAAAAAEAALSNAQKLIDAQAAIDQANASLAEAQTELQDAQTALDADSENADLLAARDAAQAKIDELNQTIADNQAYLDANAPQPEATAQPEATEAPAE